MGKKEAKNDGFDRCVVRRAGRWGTDSEAFLFFLSIKYDITSNTAKLEQGYGPYCTTKCRWRA
jgi:hypothetical protein